MLQITRSLRSAYLKPRRYFLIPRAMSQTKNGPPLQENAAPGVPPSKSSGLSAVYFVRSMGADLSNQLRKKLSD